MKITPFKKPIYVTRPMLAPIKMVDKKIREIWKSQWLTNNGPQHQLLEKEIGKTLKIKNVSLFNNGTIALLVAIQALELKGEVITTPFTFAATPHSIFWNNLKIVFCDIDPNSMCIDADKIEKLITPKTSAILAVHVFGNPCDVYKIEEIAKKYKLKVIYDCAHAFQLEIDNRPISDFGDINMFSFHATKLFNTLEGGCLTTKNSGLKKKIDLLKNFGITDEEHVESVGINGKLNEVQAAIGLINLKIINQERKKRKIIENLYLKNLKNIKGINIFKKTNVTHPSYQYFAIQINKDEYGISRDQLYEKLKKYNIFSRKYFYPLCSNFSCYSNNQSGIKEKLPIANKIVKEVLSLPFYGNLKKIDIEKICQIIKSH